MNESVDKDDGNIIDLSSLSTEEQSRLGKIRINEEVTVLNKVKCVVRCFDENTSTFGIELIKPIGEHNGTIDGIKYFECKNKRGVFLRSQDIISSKKK
eukprot:477920_1